MCSFMISLFCDLSVVTCFFNLRWLSFDLCFVDLHSESSSTTLRIRFPIFVLSVGWRSKMVHFRCIAGFSSFFSVAASFGFVSVVVVVVVVARGFKLALDHILNTECQRSNSNQLPKRHGFASLVLVLCVVDPAEQRRVFVPARVHSVVLEMQRMPADVEWHFVCVHDAVYRSDEVRMSASPLFLGSSTNTAPTSGVPVAADKIRTQSRFGPKSISLRL